MKFKNFANRTSASQFSTLEQAEKKMAEITFRNMNQVINDSFDKTQSPDSLLAKI